MGHCAQTVLSIGRMHAPEKGTAACVQRSFTDCGRVHQGICGGYAAVIPAMTSITNLL